MALRIKDNIDLKELEKFGFDTRASYAVNGVEMDFTDRWIDDHYGMIVGFGWVVWDSTREITIWDHDANLDIIFELVNAGLVEKVDKIS